MGLKRARYWCFCSGAAKKRGAAERRDPEVSGSGSDLLNAERLIMPSDLRKWLAQAPFPPIHSALVLLVL